MKPLLAVLIAAVTLAASGQDKKPSVKYLEKADPDWLYFEIFFDDDCPGIEEAFENIVEGELLRARIKRQNGWRFNDLFLNVEVSCTPTKGSAAGYSLDVQFAQYRRILDPAPDEYDFYMVYHGRKYGAYGAHGTSVLEEQLRSRLRETVSDALTDYLKANFTE